MVSTQIHARTLILASQSAQRETLLRQIGFEPVCIPADVDESGLNAESPDELVLRLAVLKAQSCAMSDEYGKVGSESGSGVILAADTIIDLDGKALGKPEDKADAVNMLQSLSDRDHLVHTGVCVSDPDNEKVETKLVTTVVRFSAISESMACGYWHTGEPAGKAGGYAIQGIGARFVVHLSGSYSNVMGLPLYESSVLLNRVGFSSF